MCCRTTRSARWNKQPAYLLVQDNQICTLKGSLLAFKFLEVLDLSNNQLRDLDKIVATLCKFKYLQNLNLTVCRYTT